MHDILKERVWRRLQGLPQDQLYQVLDYIEFLEAKYAREAAVRADPIQKFAEKLEDGMRMRSVAPRLISGTVGLLGTARKVMRTVTDAAGEMMGEVTAAASRPADATGRPPDGSSGPALRPGESPGGAGKQTPPALPGDGAGTAGDRRTET
jgi:hypothetical protein